MNEQEFFKTIAQSAIAEFKDRGSKFIAYAYSIQSSDDFKIRLQELKKEHSKAAHHCFAYRLGLDGNNFLVSDDGEPGGTAGRQILGQIDSKGLTNVLVIVVRYFGGTLLSIPGLINAYKTSTALILQLTPIVRKPVTVRLQLSFDYTQMNEVMRWVKTFNCEIIERDMQLFCRLLINFPKNNIKLLRKKLDGIRAIEIELLQEHTL